MVISQDILVTVLFIFRLITYEVVSKTFNFRFAIVGFFSRTFYTNLCCMKNIQQTKSACIYIYIYIYMQYNTSRWLNKSLK